MLKAPLNQKVASLLINLLEKNPTENGLELPLPITRKEIADTLGATVESVIRIMSEWSKMGIIQTNDQYIRVIKPDKVIEYLKVQ
jgi:CRP-like cAMP-binding protein